MANVLIVYATDWGSTKKMAEGSGVTGAHGQHGLAREALYRSGVRRALDAGQDEWQGGGCLCNRRGIR